MKKLMHHMFLRSSLLFSLLISLTTAVKAQQCRFETSKGMESATYFEAIEWFNMLDSKSGMVKVREMGTTDAGYPLHLVMVSGDGAFDIGKWKQQKKIIILINNGIHPGEPDGIDASMLLVRDIVTNKTSLPANVVLAIIPVYNIGGSLNRGAVSRVNQNGPREYGFRGNAQNLDLNRDFTKSDSKNARSFAAIFHLLDPDILIDNHVSDGADYQHTITLITTQHNKLGGELGSWLKTSFEPALYKQMATRGWPMTPYVSFETARPDKGMQQFYDPPRYSSGYAALFSTIGFIPETHMLKPYPQRVQSTFDLMKIIIAQASADAAVITRLRNQARAAVRSQKEFPLSWRLDTTQHSMVNFMGYEQAFKPSEATGLRRMYYDRDKPYTRAIKLYDYFVPANTITAPEAYLVPQGWHAVIDLLKLNGVRYRRLKSDTLITVEAYRVQEYKSAPRAYEKHHKNSGVKVVASMQSIRFLKGDYLFPMNQPANRYLAEMLEPTGDDSFFAWNYFDAILQQKEGYSDYRWDDIAAATLKNNPALAKQLLDKKKGDAAFAADASAQLEFIYKNSVYYEPEHLRYPVFRILTGRK